MQTLNKISQELEFSWKWLDSKDYPDWAVNSNRYTVTISRGDVSQEFKYFKGRGLSSVVTLDEVLESLILDWQTLEEASNFEEWADNLGYNSDSIKDLKVYESVIAEAVKLKTLLSEPELLQLAEEFQGGN